MSHYYGDDEDLGDRMDADTQMAALEAAGRREARLRKRGICSHGWTWTRLPGVEGWPDGVPIGAVQCQHEECKMLFQNEAEWEKARRKALGR